ncbi:MAG: M14 family metallopeptidase [Povalibacter sp.]
MSESPFSPDFPSARARFRNASTAAGAALSEYSYSERGPGNEVLTTDVAWLGPRDARNVLVTVSGTHGVEGFCGSGAQIEWLERFARSETKKPAPDTAVMLVHAINAYGFAWRRRVTQENIDLNRNWVDFDQALPTNDDYDQIAAAVCPTEWNDEVRQRSMAELMAYINAHSPEKFIQTVSGGQFKHPKGLFYGGTSPSAARLTLTSIFSDHLSHAARIGIIDYHSGLGPSGVGERMVIASPTSDMFDRARAWYGASVTSVSSGDSSSSKIAGGWIGAAPDLLPHAEVTAIGLEFGTVKPMLVLDALRADNWLHAYGDPQSPSAHAIKAAIFSAFYTDSDMWRGMVLGQSLLACNEALTGLQMR